MPETVPRDIPPDPAPSGDRSVPVLGAELPTTSRATLAGLLADLERVEQAGDDALDGLGDALRAVAGLLAGEPGIRRALTEPSREGGDRAGLAHRLLDGKVSGPAAEITADAAGGRWSAPRDLVDALDLVATAAEVAAADRAGSLDSLEDDLFRFSRIVAGSPPLRDALSDRTAPGASRAELVRRLLAGKTSDAAIRLAVAATTDVRARPVETALAEAMDVVAARRNRVLAVVRVAAPLTDAQRDALRTLLSRQAGRQILLNVVEDPSLIGGFRAEVGQTVVDASVASRLAVARRRLTG